MSKNEERSDADIHMRVTRDFKSEVEQYRQTQGMKNLSDASIALIKKGLSSDVDFVMFDTCDLRSYIIGHSDFYDCNKTKPKRRIKSEQCIGCKLNVIIRLPLITREKLMAQINQGKEEHQQICAKIEESKSEYSQNTVDGLREEFQYAIKRLNAAEHKISEKDSQIQKLIHDCAMSEQLVKEVVAQKDLWQTEADRLRTQNHSKVAPIQYSTEPQGLFHGNLSPTENPPIQKAESNSPLLKRTTTIKEEFVAPQQKSSLPAQQRTLLSEIILCPDIEETVNVEETCKKVCPKVDTCIYYEQIIVKKAMPKQ